MAQFYILGTGQHALLIAELLKVSGINAPCVTALPEGNSKYFMGVGSPFVRKTVWDTYNENRCRGFSFNKNMMLDTEHGNCCQAMPGAIIMPLVRLGKNVLINTGAQIDHHCVIGDHCHIAPGAVLCGNVTLGECCTIGAGAVIVQGVTLNANTLVPAGSLVVKQDDIRRPIRVLSGNGEKEAANCP